MPISLKYLKMCPSANVWFVESCSKNDTVPIVTEAYVQGGTEIQVVYPTDLYLSIISLQFEQSVITICTKIYNVDKNYKDLI